MVAMSGAAAGEVYRRDWPVVRNGQELVRALLDATDSRFGIRVPIKLCCAHPYGHPAPTWAPPSTFGCVSHELGCEWVRYFSEWMRAARESQDAAAIAVGERSWPAGQYWHFEYVVVLANVPQYLSDLLGQEVSA